MGRIKTDREFRVSKSKLDSWNHSLNETEKRMKKEGMSQKHIKMVISSQRSFLDQVEYEVKEYQSLKKGKVPKQLLKSESSQALGDALIALRVASGESQSSMARKLGVSSTQVCRDERNEYNGISSNRLFQILDILGYQIEIKKKN